MAQTDLGTGRNLIAGFISTRQLPLPADTYYIGMLLEYDAAADNYKALAVDANMSAIYNGTDGRVLAGAGVDDCIVAGEIAHGGIVDAAGAALVLTEDQIAAFAKNGFWIKEN